MTRKLAVAIIALFVAASAFASWYDDYDAGIKAVRSGQWSTVIQKMSAAIAGKGKESNNERTYGAIFINYHPYYYRGLAHLRTGKYEQAINDLEKAIGPGEIDRGSIESLMQEAKGKLADASTPEPQPAAPQPAAPQPRPVIPAPQPAAPTIDENLRQQVSRAVDAANASVTSNSRAAASPEYKQARSALMDARNRLAAAKNNDELRQALAVADNAKLLADTALAPTAIATTPTAPTPSKVQAATTEALGQTPQQVRSALESYFRGDFDDAAEKFRTLSRAMPNNAWIFAFLGASQYSQYAFEADESYREQAVQSFRKAKRLSPRFKNGLPDKYFSKRIRKAFSEIAG